jgi:hypothetical protein
LERGIPINLGLQKVVSVQSNKSKFTCANRFDENWLIRKTAIAREIVCFKKIFNVKRKAYSLNVN